MIWTALALAGTPDDSFINDPDNNWAIRPSLEVGFVAPLKNDIQLGTGGTNFDYIDEGGQDNLFFARRLSVDLALAERHHIVLLYQPLDLRSSAEARRDLVFDGITFVQGTPMEFRYGFDFYRGSYLYDLAKADDRELSLGLSLQIRNATIDFTDTAGTLRTSNRDIGPVPVLKARGAMDIGSTAWAGFEIDGFYAPIKYINGSNSDVVGAIIDASGRVGVHGRHGIDPFLNVRWIGGGAEGTESSPDPGKDGYVDNFLHFAVVSVGVTVN